MDSPTEEEPGPPPGHFSPITGGRNSTTNRSSSASSPEFEFWKVRNPIFPQPDLLSADELFVDGVLLPLQLLHLHPNHHPQPDPTIDLQPEDPIIKPALGPTDHFTSSKRWKDMLFKKGENSSSNKKKKIKEERKSGKSGVGPGTTELNINIWPFSRSRSAGNNGGARPRTPVIRKVSSAPCSRSNSAGDSKSRKWPVSPARPGVHLGRASPVWQGRRLKKDGPGKANRALNLNVPMCIGYRQNIGCRSDESSALAVAAVGSGGGGAPGGDCTRGSSHIFNLRSLFTKKVY